MAVSREDEREVRVAFLGFFHLRSDVLRYRVPRFQEATVDLASLADVGEIDQGEVEVREPVFEIRATPEGQDDGFVGWVHRDVPCDAAVCFRTSLDQSVNVLWSTREGILTSRIHILRWHQQPPPTDNSHRRR